MRLKRMTFTELVKQNKREIMENPHLLDKIEARIENRAQKNLTEVYTPQKVKSAFKLY